jgi:hypothetical protein
LKTIIPQLHQLWIKLGIYNPQLKTQPSAVPELLSDHVYTCSNLCSDDCVCLGNEQPCTIKVCSCKGVLQGQIHLPCWQMLRQMIILMMVVHSEIEKKTH